MALTFDLSSPVIVFESKQFRETEDILIQELGVEEQFHVNSFTKKPKIKVLVKKYYGPLRKD